MERRDEMILFLADTMAELMKKWLKRLQELQTIQIKPAVEMIDSLCRNHFGKFSFSVVITWLRSSYVTGSHRFKIALYEKEPFIEEEPPAITISLSTFFECIEKDMRVFEKVLQKQYIQIIKSELEEVRRYYLEQLYANCHLFFEQVIKVLQMDSQSRQIAVFYGEEMGMIRPLGII